MKFCWRVMRTSPPSALGQIGDGDHLVARDEAEVHRHADVARARLLLRVHAEVVGERPGGGSAKSSSVRPSRASTRSRMPSGPIVVDHELEARLDAGDAVARSSLQASISARSTSTASSLGTKTPRSRAMRGTEESPPPTSTPKPSRPSWSAPTSAMQLISGALQRCGAGRDRELVLARQVRVVGVAVEELGRLVDDRRGVEQLVGVEALHRAAGDVAHGVAAAARGREPGRVELGEDLGQGAISSQWSCTFCRVGELAVAAAEAVRDLADRPQLGRASACPPAASRAA